MNRSYLLILLIFVLAPWSAAQTFKFEVHEAKSRIDLLLDGKLFTSYRWEERIRRPVLFPIMSAGGNFVTRGFPVETRSGETVNHPHQVGMTLVYGDVNGIDFWNNSPFRSAEELKRMGTIVHREVMKQHAGKGQAELITRSEWLMPDGKTILSETTKFIFRAAGKTRTVDRQTTLTANQENVTFGDNKEGLFMIHLNRHLQQPSEAVVKITDEKGNISETKATTNISGEYSNSEGLKGDKIWGTVGRWASATGTVGDENITVAVFDHPKNLNYPSYMMVRGYGLLALNPFGKKAFVENAEPRKFVLEKGKSISFRHQLVIYSEKAPAGKIEQDFVKFIK